MLSCPAQEVRRRWPPLVLVAPSTAQDSEHHMLSAALEGLAGAPVQGPCHLEPQVALAAPPGS